MIIANPPCLAAYGIANAKFDPRVIPESYIMLREMPEFPFTATTQDTANLLKTLSPRYPIVRIRQQAVISTGKSVLEAFDRLEVAEYSAKATLMAGPLGRHDADERAGSGRRGQGVQAPAVMIRFPIRATLRNTFQESCRFLQREEYCTDKPPEQFDFQLKILYIIPVCDRVYFFGTHNSLKRGKIMSGILLLLLAFSIGGSLCAGTPPENGGDSLFSQLTRGETNPGRHAARRNGNMLIIRTDKGAGSGFIVNKWNRPVIVSNAHVYLTGRNPRVFDVNDREYEIKEVIASKSRDLVFLVFEPFPGETAKPLEVEEDVSALEPDTRLTAYGNSLAGNVIRRSDGVLQAVGPQTIETTVPFVTGNSGGPLVTTDGGKVVGVATYMIRIRDDWTKQGSGFEQKKWWKPVVRRFATRIDNIDVSDLEQIDMRKIAECDLTMCERAQEVTCGN